MQKKEWFTGRYMEQKKMLKPKNKEESSKEMKTFSISSSVSLLS
jgi:hypothetical protein